MFDVVVVGSYFTINFDWSKNRTWTIVAWALANQIGSCLVQPPKTKIVHYNSFWLVQIREHWIIFVVATANQNGSCQNVQRKTSVADHEQNIRDNDNNYNKYRKSHTTPYIVRSTARPKKQHCFDWLHLFVSHVVAVVDPFHWSNVEVILYKKHYSEAEKRFHWSKS
jgi:hypothetical protein